jgi:hypothetical protein
MWAVKFSGGYLVRYSWNGDIRSFPDARRAVAYMNGMLWSL